MDSYKPGVCNIGKKEIEYRRNFGIVGAVLSVVTAVFLYFLRVPNVYKLILFLPVYASSFGFLQAKLHFCAEFALTGVFNFSDKLRNTETITQKEFRKRDQVKAIKILIYSFIIASIVTYIFMLIW